MRYYVGVDIGGTNIRAAVGTADLTTLAVSKTPTPRTSSEAEFLESVTHVITQVCAQSDIDPTAVTAAGIGSAGPLDTSAGAIVNPTNLSEGIDRIRIVDHLETVLETGSIVLRNDAVCGVLAEHALSEKKPDNLVYLTISTGIGAGVVVDGSVLSGHRGNAAEVGHMTIDPTGQMTCGCGRRGHWEAYCSGANIPDYATVLYRENAVETRLPVTDTEVPFTAKDVFDVAGSDPLADLVIERLSRWNTIGFANVIHAFAPTRIAVGGAVALNNPDAVLGPVRENLSEHVMIDMPAIERSEHGDEIVLKGALLLAQENGLF